MSKNPTNPGDRRDREDDRQNTQEDISPGGGYGTDDTNPSDLHFEKEADLYNGEDFDVVASTNASADADFSWEEQELGASAQARVDVYGGEFVNANVNAGASAGVHLSPQTTQIGAELGAGGEVSLGSSGNQVAVGAGYGIGGGFGITHGEDSDGDGKTEYGGSISFKYGIGGNLSFRVEPEAIWDRTRELFGFSREKTGTYVERISEGVQPSGMRRLDEAYARLQSLL